MSRNRNDGSAPVGSLSAIFGSLFGIGFLIFWTAGVARSGGPLIMVAIGVFCLVVTVKGLFDDIAAYRKRKMHEDFYGSSVYPYEDIYGENSTAADSGRDYDTAFSSSLADVYQYTDAEGNIYCPYCGVKIAHDFEFCPKCGKKLPFNINY